MADIKIIKYDGRHKTEHDPANDSLQLVSFKTATKELTDARLARLIEGADAADEHIHDGRYFRKDQFLDESTGVADAGMPVILGSDGKIDLSMVDSSSVDHDDLDGVANSVAHTKFPLLDGTREIEGIYKYDSAFNFTDDRHIPDVGFVRSELASAQIEGHWQDSAIDILTTPPVSPSAGDRYLIADAGATGDFAGHEDEIAEFDGTNWIFTQPQTGFKISVLDETDKIYYYGGVANGWEEKLFEASTASSGLMMNPLDPLEINLNPGHGIEVVANQTAVKPSELVGTGIKTEDDGGVDLFAIDFSTTFNDARAIAAQDLASTSNGKGASIIGVEDSNNYFTGTNQEAVNNELFEMAKKGGGVEYSAGTGGVTKGDLVYISANNTVLTFDDLTDEENVVGLALTSAAATEGVVVARFDKLLEGVLTGATAGEEFYWDGSDFVSTPSDTSGEHVYLAGVAVNATDLSIEVRHLYKNS